MLRWLVLPMALFAYLAVTVSAATPRDRDHDRLPDRWERIRSPHVLPFLALDTLSRRGVHFSDMVADFNCGQSPSPPSGAGRGLA